ncbi:retrotransposon protein [Cucumis melo var. makuwa]|uniref:Retrotransposon protein n=1 Tax=Cucumis melo var. makuwa TaxID=1194695 RepID=A0A5A7UHU4_CUCMM|nr:retrotransposon protein [Cucumis melo var. makuwa]
MKKTFHAISEMRGPFYSGFGWNDELKCITIEKDVIDDWVKILSHYDDISYVFKRDRVTEGRSETFVDVGSNVPSGTKDLVLAMTMIWRTLPEFVASRPRWSGDGRNASSGSKKKRVGQPIVTADII